MDYSKISVVTVCYNAMDTIERTILSVINQTYPNIEYIIIDGASVDGTVDIINKYRDKIACFVSEPDNGIYDAMNKGIKMSTGEWILFRNSGDYFFNEECIQRVFNRFIDNGEDFILCISRCIKKGLFKDYEPSILSKSFYDVFPVNHPATFIRRSIHLRHPFQSKYKNSADFNFFIETFKEGAKYVYINEIVAIMDCERGTSVDNNLTSYIENIDILEKHCAPQLSIRRFQRILFISRIKNQISRHMPFFDCFFKFFLRLQGWKPIN